TGSRNRLEYQLVDGFWIETDVLRKLQPAAPMPSEPPSVPPWLIWAAGAALLVVIAVIGFWLARR
ncbi:MAG TPA: hypothetical protein VGA39_01525, partial [Candidatus Acidoferrales bacterium]